MLWSKAPFTMIICLAKFSFDKTAIKGIFLFEMETHF